MLVGAVIGNWFKPLLGTRMILLSVALLVVAFLVMFVDRREDKAARKDKPAAA